MLKTICLPLFLAAALAASPVQAIPAGMAGKVVAETIEAVAKRSGRALAPGAREAAERALAKAFAQYGDEALKIVEKGGLEAIEQGAKHGDEFWKLCAHAPPQAVRSMAIHADELLPIAKRVGPDFMRLEGKVPGLGAKVVSTFGDDAAKSLANAPAADISRLLGYAAKADSPATQKLLLDAYTKKGSHFLDKLNWKHIMATGLSAAMVTAAYKVSDGAQDGLKHLAKEEPEKFIDAIFKLTAPVRYGLYALLAILLFPLAFASWKICRHVSRWGRKKASPSRKKL